MPEPVTVRDISGAAFDIRPEDVDAYRARGFQIETPEQRVGRVTSDVQSDIYGGIGGKIASFGAGALRTATLGLSDVAGEALGIEHDLRALRDESPMATLGGELLGAFAPIGPAHALTGIGKKIVSAGEGAGAVARAGITAGAAAVEGAGFGGGMYLSQVALDDKPLAAEGFIGAMGHGALFAAPIGGALSLGQSTLLRARSLFPQQTVTREAALGVKQQAASEIGQSVADGDQMAQAIARKIELTDAKIGIAETGERVTRRMFGDADQLALGDQVAGTVEKQQLAAALQKYQASRAQLSDWLRHEADPDLEDALSKLVAPEVGEIGGRIEKRAGSMFEPELAAGTPVSPELRALNDALDMRSRQVDVTRVGKRPANDVVPEELLAGVGKPAGVPEYASLKAQLDDAGRDFVEATVPARDIAARGYYEPLGGGVDAVRVGKAKKAIEEGQREPISLLVTPSGKITVEGGRHRLAAAVEANAPIKVKWSTGFEPSEEMVLRGGAAPADDLLSALRSNEAALSSGADLGKLSRNSSAAADYATKKLAKRADDAAYFRAKAIDKNYEGSAMAVVEREAQAARPTGLEGALDAQRLASQDVAADDFFASLTRPKSRDQYVAQNIGRAMREEGGNHASALVKVEREWAARSRRDVGKSIVDHARLAADDGAVVGRALSKRAGKNVDIGPDLNRAAKAIGDHEAALADMAEALGAEAPVTAVARAKAFRSAVADQADVAAMGFAKTAQDLRTKVQPKLDTAPGVRTPPAASDATSVDSEITRAVRLHDARTPPPPAPPPAPSVRTTFGGETVVDSDIAKAIRAHDAKASAKLGPPAAPPPTPSAAAPSGSVLGKLADAGTALEVLQAMGVHTPDISKIPVIGPVLSLFLKARAVMSILGRKGGSIPRSTEGLVAQKSSETRNRINAATTALLEGGARGARKAASYSAGPAVLLGTRLFPGDDSETRSKDARKLYEARIDELARAQAPGAIAAAVADRIQTSDPMLFDAIVAQITRGLRFLDSKAPKQTVAPGMVPGDGVWHPSKVALEEWGKYVHAVNDPASVIEDLAKGHISMEGAETLRVVYPALFAEAQRLLLESAPKMQQTMSYSKRVAISIMYRVPVDASMTPRHMQFLQPPPEVAAAQQGMAPPQAGPAPTAPALTGPLQIGQQTMSPLDRRAGA